MLKKLLSVGLSAVMAAGAMPLAYAVSDNSLPENTVIVVAENCPATDTTAAQVIQNGIKLVTGKTIEIVDDSAEPADFEIAVGNTSRYETEVDDLEDGSYRIKSYEGGVSVAGAGNRGTIYGAYAFIEKCGNVHNYSASIGLKAYSDKFVVPSDMDIDYDVFFEYTDTDWRSPRDVQYSLANGLNGGPYRSIPANQGGTVNYISSFCHTLSTQFCSVNTYFADHPEYFALHDGERIGEYEKAQLCLTNPDVLRIVTDEVIALAKQRHDPSAAVQIISLTQNDNYNYCECDKCKALDAANGGHSGSLITFINQVARAVKEAGFDNIAIDTFAYQYTRQAPTNVRPDDNVIIRFCTIEGCFAHSIGDESCKYNKDLRNDLIAWGKICNRIYVWDYTTNYARTIGIFPDFGVLQKNMQFFYENGVKGVYEEGAYYVAEVDTEFSELRAYLLARLMQDPYCDYYAEMDNFCRAYYGEGWECVRDFILMTIEKPVGKGERLSIYMDMDDTLSFNAKDIRKADELWAGAKELAKNNQVALANIERSELCWRYWKCCNQKAEFAKFSTRGEKSEELYNDVVAAGTTRFCEGKDNYLDKPQNFTVLDGEYWRKGNAPMNFFDWLLIRILELIERIKNK